jgi:hypothetical protein
LDVCLGVEPRRVEIVLAKGLHEWGRQAVPLFNYALAFALQLRKSTEKLSQTSRIVLGTGRSVDLPAIIRAASTVLLSLSPARLNVGDFSKPLVSISTFQVAKLRAFPHQLTLSRSSQFMLYVAGGKYNSKILVNLPVTDVSRCVSRNAKTLGLQHLQLPEIVANSGPADWACIVIIGRMSYLKSSTRFRWTGHFSY